MLQSIYKTNQKVKKTTNENIKDGLEELNNLYTFATIPTELDEETWNNLFGNLNSTLKDGEVLYDLYYDLALYFHETYCKYDHYYNECEVVTCDEVKLMLTY